MNIHALAEYYMTHTHMHTHIDALRHNVGTRSRKLAVCELGCNEACEDKAIDIFRRWNAEMIRRKKLTKKPRQKV